MKTLTAYLSNQVKGVIQVGNPLSANEMDLSSMIRAMRSVVAKLDSIEMAVPEIWRITIRSDSTINGRKTSSIIA
jgi:hypothetical protein